MSYVLDDILNDDEIDTKHQKTKKGLNKYRSYSQEKREMESQSEVQEFYDCIEPFEFPKEHEEFFKPYQAKEHKSERADGDECKSNMN